MNIYVLLFNDAEDIVRVWGVYSLRETAEKIRDDLFRYNGWILAHTLDR